MEFDLQHLACINWSQSRFTCGQSCRSSVAATWSWASCCEERHHGNTQSHSRQWRAVPDCWPRSWHSINRCVIVNVDVIQNSSNEGWMCSSTALVGTSGRFVKREQWERWRTSINLCLCPSTGGASAGKHFEIVHAKSCNLVHFGRKMVRNAANNAFLNTLTMGTAFPRVPLEMTAGRNATSLVYGLPACMSVVVDGKLK